MAYLAAPGDSYTIVKNDGGTISGNFDDMAGNVLTEGSTFAAGGQEYQITYAGGSGSDVVVTNVTAPATLTVDGTTYATINAAVAAVTQPGTVIDVVSGYASTTEDVDLTTIPYGVLLNLEIPVTLGSLKTKTSDAVNLDGQALTVGDGLNTTIAGNIIDRPAGGTSTRGLDGHADPAGKYTFTGLTTIGRRQAADRRRRALQRRPGRKHLLKRRNLLFNTAPAGLTYGHAISGSSGTVTKLGGGTLVLSGANTYGGTTTVTGGTLQIGDGSTTGVTFTMRSPTTPRWRSIRAATTRRIMWPSAAWAASPSSAPTP